jgi:hypothetical protein
LSFCGGLSLVAAETEMLEALVNIMHDYESSIQKGYVKQAIDMAARRNRQSKGR